jgi:predicted acetyltransferase
MRPKGTLSVAELTAATPEAYLRLWRFCCEVDLITGVQAGDRPVHEPLVWSLVDGRSLRQTGRFDFVWVRVLDVAAALAARNYSGEGRLVIEVTDTLGIAGGRFALEGGPDGATCSATDATAQLTVPVDVLGALYLGGMPARDLAYAGRIDEHVPDAVARADAMFHSPITPWCSTWF